MILYFACRGGECGYVFLFLFFLFLCNGERNEFAVIRMILTWKFFNVQNKPFFHQIRLNLNTPIILPTNPKMWSYCNFIYIFTICIYLLVVLIYITAMLFLVMLDTCLDFVLGFLAKDGIIEKSEALMVARGDLGYSAAMSFASHPFWVSPNWKFGKLKNDIRFKYVPSWSLEGSLGQHILSCDFQTVFFEGQCG